jgi:hypothetical protein
MEKATIDTERLLEHREFLLRPPERARELRLRAAE